MGITAGVRIRAWVLRTVRTKLRIERYIRNRPAQLPGPWAVCLGLGPGPALVSVLPWRTGCTASPAGRGVLIMQRRCRPSASSPSLTAPSGPGHLRPAVADKLQSLKHSSLLEPRWPHQSCVRQGIGGPCWGALWGFSSPWAGVPNSNTLMTVHSRVDYN